MIIPAGSKKIQRVLVKGFLIVFNKLLFIRGFKGYKFGHVKTYS